MRRSVLIVLGAALLGATLGVLVVVLNAPDPAPCVTTPDGMRACMPVLVIPPPWWAYVVAGLTGALLATALVLGARWLHRHV